MVYIHVSDLPPIVTDYAYVAAVSCSKLRQTPASWIRMFNNV